MFTVDQKQSSLLQIISATTSWSVEIVEIVEEIYFFLFMTIVCPICVDWLVPLNVAIN
uniref:Uncharacterized protein n=1 Tax=Arion vulgaris TaxID=1028688 RepID=A0A0B6Y8Q3_9EUPU